MMNGIVFDAGILITAGLAVIGYLWKLSRERKESARTLLFHLMEIRQELLIERPKLAAAVDAFQADFQEILGDRPNLRSVLDKGFPREYVATTLTSLMDGLVRADPKLLESYEIALYDYSRINPLLAHRVRGMKLLPKLSQNLTGIMADLTGALPDDEGAELVSSLGKKELESSSEKALQEFVLDLEKIIRRISFSAGMWFWACSWFLGARRRRDAIQDKSESIDLRGFMESFFRAIALANNPPGEVREQIQHAKLDDILDLWEASLE